MLLFMAPQIVPQKLVPDLAGYGLRHVAGDVVESAERVEALFIACCSR
ncbi:hypothetical protein [Streptomyces sp. NPDC058953]